MTIDNIFGQYGIGLDRIFNEMNRDRIQRQSNYPPYNVRKLEGYKTLLEIAVAGFKEEELTIEFAEDILKIIGEKKDQYDVSQYTHHGIATRPFSKIFVLSPDVKIKNVALEDGMLRLLLDREIPEHKKPRKIPIGKPLDISSDVSDEKLLLQEEEEIPLKEVV